MANDLVPSNPGEFLFYQTEDGRTRLQVRMEGETVWLSQKAMADLFQKDVRTISEHIRNIFEEGELPPEAVVRNFRITAADNKPREIRPKADATAICSEASSGLPAGSSHALKLRVEFA